MRKTSVAGVWKTRFQSLSSLSLLFTCKQEENSIFHFIEKHMKTRQLPELMLRGHRQFATSCCKGLLSIPHHFARLCNTPTDISLPCFPPMALTPSGCLPLLSNLKSHSPSHPMCHLNPLSDPSPHRAVPDSFPPNILVQTSTIPKKSFASLQI